MEDDTDRIQAAWLRERPGTPVTSIGVVTRVWRIARLLESDRRRTMARLGVDAGLRDLLSTLRRAGPPYALSPSEIARQSAVTPARVSQQVAHAERAGWVERRRSTQDRRSNVIELTEDGHAVVERIVDELLHHEEGLIGGLDADQQGQLADLLRILLADLTPRVAEVEPGDDF